MLTNKLDWDLHKLDYSVENLEEFHDVVSNLQDDSCAFQYDTFGTTPSVLIYHTLNNTSIHTYVLIMLLCTTPSIMIYKPLAHFSLLSKKPYLMNTPIPLIKIMTQFSIHLSHSFGNYYQRTKL